MTAAAAVVILPGLRQHGGRREGAGRPSYPDLVTRIRHLEGRNVALTERNAELRDEIDVLRAEIAKAGLYLLALGTTLEIACHSGRADVVQAVRARLRALGESCLRRGRGR